MLSPVWECATWHFKMFWCWPLINMAEEHPVEVTVQNKHVAHFRSQGLGLLHGCKAAQTDVKWLCWRCFPALWSLCCDLKKKKTELFFWQLEHFLNCVIRLFCGLNRHWQTSHLFIFSYICKKKKKKEKFLLIKWRSTYNELCFLPCAHQSEMDRLKISAVNELQTSLPVCSRSMPG